MNTFEEMITKLETAIEEVFPYSQKARSYRANLIFERLAGVQNAIDDWRQGGPG